MYRTLHETALTLLAVCADDGVRDEFKVCLEVVRIGSKVKTEVDADARLALSAKSASLIKEHPCADTDYGWAAELLTAKQHDLLLQGSRVGWWEVQAGIERLLKASQANGERWERLVKNGHKVLHLDLDHLLLVSDAFGSESSDPKPVLAAAASLLRLAVDACLDRHVRLGFRSAPAQDDDCLEDLLGLPDEIAVMESRINATASVTAGAAGTASEMQLFELSCHLPILRQAMGARSSLEAVVVVRAEDSAAAHRIVLLALPGAAAVALGISPGNVGVPQPIGHPLPVEDGSPRVVAAVEADDGVWIMRPEPSDWPTGDGDCLWLVEATMERYTGYDWSEESVVGLISSTKANDSRNRLRAARGVLPGAFRCAVPNPSWAVTLRQIDVAAAVRPAPGLVLGWLYDELPLAVNSVESTSLTETYGALVHGFRGGAAVEGKLKRADDLLLADFEKGRPSVPVRGVTL
jgi:hypothetical protein